MHSMQLWLLHSHITIGSGEDFDSGTFDLTIKPGAVNASTHIAVTCDNVVEEEMEIFNISLELNNKNPQITMGRIKSTGQIIDSTGKACKHS